MEESKPTQSDAFPEPKTENTLGQPMKTCYRCKGSGVVFYNLVSTWCPMCSGNGVVSMGGCATCDD